MKHDNMQALTLTLPVTQLTKANRIIDGLHWDKMNMGPSWSETQSRGGMTSLFLSVMETRSNTTELDNWTKEASSSPGELHSEHFRNWWNIIAEMQMVSVSISGLRVLRWNFS